MVWHDAEEFEDFEIDEHATTMDTHHAPSLVPLRADSAANEGSRLQKYLRSWRNRGNSLTRQQLGALRECFARDEFKNQTFSSTQAFREYVYNTVSLPENERLQEEFLNGLFKAFDMDGNETLDADEASSMLAVFASPSEEAARARLFDSQAKGKGTLEKADIEAMLRKNVMVRSAAESKLDDGKLKKIKEEFEKYSDDDGRMNVDQLADAMGHKGRGGDVQKIFGAFDTDNSGYIDVEEFITAMRTLNPEGSNDDLQIDSRLLVAFSMADTDASGSITHKEMRPMLEAAAGDMLEKGSISEEKLGEMVEVFMNHADTDGSGCISYEEFAATMRKYPEDAKALGLGQTSSMVIKDDRRPREPEKKSISATLTTQGNKVKGCCQSWYDMFKKWTWWHYSVMFLYLGIGIGWMIYRCTILDEDHKLHQLFAPWALCLARGSASPIMISSAVVLLPMCRTFSTWLRNNGPRSFPWDDGIEFHKFVAVMILILTTMHCVGHAHNYYRVMTKSWNSICPVLGSNCNSPKYGDGSGVLQEGFTFLDVLSSGPTWTGIIMVVVFVIAYPCCFESLRQRIVKCCYVITGQGSKFDVARGTSFNTFWFTHHLFLLFLTVCTFHGAWAWLRTPLAPYYITPCLFIYVVEKCLRGAMLRYKERDESVGHWLKHIFIKKPMDVVVAKQHPQAKALELHVRKPADLKYMAGQYCFINIPEISRYEWHPFTLTSAPNEKCLKFHIAAVGDWTKSLYDMFPHSWKDEIRGSSDWEKTKRSLAESISAEVKKSPSEEQQAVLADVESALLGSKHKVYVDGPYGAPAQDFTKYPVAILVGAGIGVTPFAAVLQDLVHLVRTWKQYKDNPLGGLKEITAGAAAFPVDFELEKVHFHWSTRSQDALSWFSDMMNELLEADEAGMLELTNYCTTLQTSSLFNTVCETYTKQTGEDVLSGLSTANKGKGTVKTVAGRPDFDAIFLNAALLYGERDIKIGVFFCGPKVIRAILEDKCKKYSKGSKYWKEQEAKGNPVTSVRFKLHAENF